MDAGAGRGKTKTCAVCGREIRWRKKWARDWEQVRYCSDACRSRGGATRLRTVDAALEAAILELLTARGRGKTICPSEAARLVAARSSEEHTAAGKPADPKARENWQPLMEPARAAARRLYAAGRLRITQGGHAIDPSHAKGPIRLELV